MKKNLLSLDAVLKSILLLFVLFSCGINIKNCNFVASSQSSQSSPLKLFSLHDQTSYSRLKNCKTSNIDIFISPHSSAFSGLQLLWQSIKIFMPCRGDTHIFIEPNDTVSILTWIPYWDDSIKLHYLPDYMLNSGIRGYIVQDWIKMWSDNFTNAEYIMFFDTDCILTLPTNYKSLFHHKTKKAYLPHWNMSVITDKVKRPIFKATCDILLGISCDMEFMAYFPMMIPRNILKPMRIHMTPRIQPPNSNNSMVDFDSAFISWFPHLPQNHNLCFLTVMGNYLKKYSPESMYLLHCLAYDGGSAEFMKSECLNYIHPGIIVIVIITIIIIVIIGSITIVTIIITTTISSLIVIIINITICILIVIIITIIIIYYYCYYY